MADKNGEKSVKKFEENLSELEAIVRKLEGDVPLDEAVAAFEKGIALSKACMDELKKENLILRLPGAGTRTLFENNLNSNNETIDDFNVIMEVDNISIIKELVKNNFGVSVLAHSTCLNEIKKKKFSVIPVENLSITREINLIYHQDFEYTDILNEITRLYSKVSSD